MNRRLSQGPWRIRTSGGKFIDLKGYKHSLFQSINGTIEARGCGGAGDEGGDD